MNSLSQRPNSFKKWILESRYNRLLLVLSAIMVIAELTWFKILYPFPNFLPDSYSYIDAGFKNQEINIWPIGYSKFLRLFSCFTSSHQALVAFQYLFLQASIFYLTFSVTYLLSLRKHIILVLLCFNILNPLPFYVSNFVSSDSIFASLSLIWFTQLLWITFKPSLRLLTLHSVVLAVAFIFRYNALYYPMISFFVISFSPSIIKHKALGILTTILLVGGFIGQTVNKYRTATGTGQFSAFGGWQLASNALFAYAHSKPIAAQSVPAKFRKVHEEVNKHMEALSHLLIRPDNQLGIYYLWDEHAPLKQYMRTKYLKDSTTDGFIKWARIGPYYAQYGAYLIRQRPASFIGHYIFPNLRCYYAPPVEFLGTYNMGIDTMELAAQNWFKLKSNKVRSLLNDKNIKSTEYLPIALAVINLVFILSFLAFFLLEGSKMQPGLIKKILMWTMAVWICNLAFSVLASPIVLRYQVFPFVFTYTFMVLLIDYILQETRPSSYKLNMQQGGVSPNEFPVQIS